MYKIIRFYRDRSHNFHRGRRVIARGLTLEQAQAHCGDPETSSSTCTKAAGKARTRRMGPWFDGYDQE